MIPKEVLIKALQLRFSECYGALCLVNSLAGDRTPVWDLLYTKTTNELLFEAKQQNIDFENLEVDFPKGELIKSTYAYITLNPITTREQFKQIAELEKLNSAKIEAREPGWDVLYSKNIRLRQMMGAYRKQIKLTSDETAL